jgi:small subunit ribosomal protein S6
MNHYETLFVVKPTLTQEEIVSQIEKVKAVLEKEGAELLATQDMGMRKLAYSVEKHNRGYYTVLYFNAKGDVIAELERNIRNNEDIIKFLTIKYTKMKEVAHFNKLVDTANKKGKTEAAAEVAETAAETVAETVTETVVAAEEQTEA